MKQIILLLIIGLLSAKSIAQKADCIVAIDSLKGMYEGDCSGGKAAGTGKAKGADSYEGNFKNGYPDGQGKYTWRNGSFYDGAWKKGQRDGKGEMHYKTVGGKDSVVVTGYWKKDVYKGEYEHPYVVVTSTTEVGRIQATKIDAKINSITVSVESLGGGGSLYNSGNKATVVMTNNQVTRGSYLTKTQNTLGNKDVTTFRAVVYPFRAIFNIGNSIVEMEFFEAGNWDVLIPINK